MWKPPYYSIIKTVIRSIRVLILTRLNRILRESVVDVCGNYVWQKLEGMFWWDERIKENASAIGIANGQICS